MLKLYENIESFEFQEYIKGKLLYFMTDRKLVTIKQYACICSEL